MATFNIKIFQSPYFNIQKQIESQLECIVLVALIMQAFEIQEEKLTLPFSDKDKEALTSRFQFE